MGLFLCVLGFYTSLTAREAHDLVEKLPEWIKSVEGEITVFADFDHPEKNGSIPLYVINRTKKMVELPYQNGDVYLKLEAKVGDGKWKRVQPHGYSWCGNSYGEYEIEPERYISVKGYRAKDGEKQEVRYSFYGSVVKVSSNVGMGLVSKIDAKNAANDAMAVFTGDFNFVSDVALGNIVLKNEMDHINDQQQQAISKLGSGDFPMKQSRKILIKVAKKFPDKKKVVYQALTYRERTLKLLTKMALLEDVKALRVDDADHEMKFILQSSAIQQLASARFPVKESREVLKQVLKKFPDLKQEIEDALLSLDSNGKNLLPTIK